MYLWTAFSIGVLGSLHCVGMCGPLALALPYQTTNRWSLIQHAFTYNLGRVSTYALIGLLPGLMGQGLSMAGFQKSTAVVLGIVFVVMAIFSYSISASSFDIPFLSKITNWAQLKMGSLLKDQGNPGFYAIGLVNGLLPCGLVYMALAGALTQTTARAGAGYMVLFGLGTMPLMLAVGLTKLFVSVRLRNIFRRLAPVVMALIGILLIFRGLNVTIPGHLGTLIELGVTTMCH